MTGLLGNMGALSYSKLAPVYLIIGVSGSGKSWVARQLADKFNYLPHDRCWKHVSGVKPTEGLDPKWGPPGSESTHMPEIIKLARESTKPILTEVPFGERKLKEDLEKEGIKVTPVFVVEHPSVVARRYNGREGKFLSKAVLTRASSIKERAKEWNAFQGTSDEVLEHLKTMEFEK